MSKLALAAAVAVALTLTGGAAVAADQPPAPVRIMPLGDSITYGVGTPAHDSYRTDLLRRLTAAGAEVDLVGSQRSGTGPDRDHEGHPGWTIAQLTERIDGWLATYRPDVVLLHIGTNDMHAGNTAAARDLADLLDRIHAARPSADVLVAKIIGLGRTPRTGAQAKRTDAFNRAVERVVAARGAPFRLVDHTDVRGIDMVDRLHPNAFGFRAMAWNWYRALEPVLRPAGPAWPATDDPNRTDFAVRCLGRTTTYPAELKGCHRWHRRLAPGAVTSRVWQLPVPRRVTVNGQQVTTIRWVTAG